MDDERGRLLAFPQAPEAIELRHLRAFVAVAEELNFGRAATRLYVSQPALSRQIRGLERLVGCELLRRSTHRVELTLAGEALLDRARPLLRDVEDAISATRSVGGELAGRVERLWSPLVDLTAAKADPQETRAAYEALHAQFSPPPEVETRPVNAGGVHALVLTPEPNLPATLLYLHGGGYTLGSAFGYRPLVGALAAAAETGAVVPEYRLAPEHPFPAALDDAHRAYRWMLDCGVDPGQVTFAGDSSGGSLVVSLLTRLKQRDEPLPGGVVLLCPWLNLAGNVKRRPPQDEQTAVMVEQEQLTVDGYLAGHPTDDPVVNPFIADLAGLPPTLIQGATGDYVVDDAHQLTERARGHGVDVRLELYSVEMHVFHLFWSFLPEAADALEHAGEFTREIRGQGMPPRTVQPRSDAS